MNDIAILNFDGGSVPNPGKGGCGFIIKYLDKKISGSIYLGNNMTNNKAEYSGLLNGLKECVRQGISDVNVYGDSKLVIEQMKGNWKVKNEELKKYYLECKEYENKFKSISYNHVYREENKEADENSDKAIKTENTIIIS